MYLKQRTGVFGTWRRSSLREVCECQSAHLNAVGLPGCVCGAHVLTQMLVPDDVEMLSWYSFASVLRVLDVPELFLLRSRGNSVSSGPGGWRRADLLLSPDGMRLGTRPTDPGLIPVHTHVHVCTEEGPGNVSTYTCTHTHWVAVNPSFQLGRLSPFLAGTLSGWLVPTPCRVKAAPFLGWRGLSVDLGHGHHLSRTGLGVW